MAGKKSMSNKERALLAEQMDKDLQEFILEKIEANKDVPIEPFDFKKMEEAMVNHPAFMTEWDPSKPMTPEMEALINIKYEECDDATEKATNYKDDGNVNFKNSKYRWAIDNYTVAIQCQSPDKILNAVCYTNRAAAQYRLGNIRSAFQDVVFARKFVPDHMKAIVRGANCACKMRKFAIALRWIESGLLIDPSHQELLNLRQTCEKLQKEEERDKRKEQAKERKQEKKRKTLLDAVKLRSIQLRGVYGEDHDEEGMVGEEWESLFGRTANTEAASARVFVDDFGTMHWPLLLMYPEYGQTDLISQANETTRLYDLLYQVFGPETPSASWDEELKYKLDRIEVFFEDREKQSLYELNFDTSIQSVLSHPKYIVYGGLPTLIVLVKNSNFASEFLSKHEAVHRQ
ncbi:tetratricopeptide repeat protein 4-like isoform X1 [Watersipora subatra]|uniref:tetratricopeptide repeat protein 4-like isoform X1 n=1 Tax=Watersipora subatra TaxID=2589382 RepID=UPI00355B55DF